MLKNEGRGSYDYHSDVKLGVCVITWCENICIHQDSAFFRVAAAGIAKQKDAKEKFYIDASLSDMVLD